MATSKEELYPIKSLHFEALHGDKKGLFLVKVNDQYRIEFSLTENLEEPILTICNIVELSNHYDWYDNTSEHRPVNDCQQSDFFWADSPGELIRDELEERHLTQAKLAEQIGVSPSLLNEVINGKRSVNTELALLLEAALGISANMFLQLQADYNMQKAKSDSTFMSRLTNIRKIAAL